MIKITGKDKRNCAIYVRVSKEDLHPENQVKALKTFSSEHNYRVVGIYTDVISGRKSSRPALIEMLKDAYDKKFNVVLVWKLDRLGRSLQHLIKVIQYFHKWDVDFICTTQNIDTTTGQGKLVFHILGAMAEFESDLISDRTKLGLARSKKKGGRPKGSKDKRPRKKSGYYLRYQKKGTLPFFDLE